MAKYTEAYNDITNRNIDIMHVRKECAVDPAAYERNYRGHLFCPGCGVVPLTLVHDKGRLYFRGHPNAVHPDRCVFVLDEHIVKDISRLRGEDEDHALAQRDFLFRLTFATPLLNANRQPANGNGNRNDAHAEHQHQVRQNRLPQCRLEELPYRIESNKLPEGVCIYYGVVNCQLVSNVTNERYKDKKETVNVLLLKECYTGTTLMALTLSGAIWEHFDTNTKNVLQNSTNPIHIAFLALSKNFSTSLFSSPYTCYLRSSTYLVARAD